MNYEEIMALRRAFNSVKEKQAQNRLKDFTERKRKLKVSRELCVGNEELLGMAIDNLEKSGIKVYPVKENPEDIMKIVREDVISGISSAKTGITGANAITAEEGSILMTYNEGNVREVMRKEKHIVVTSIDKLYPDIEAAVNMIKILSYNATGSIIPSFIDVVGGVSKTADVEKKFIKGVHHPSEVTLILLDNKRSELARNGFKELLMCIGCGNCLLHCPMYNTIGNEYAIDNYLGGKGLAYYSLYNNDKNDKLKFCLTCGKCRENCPLELDIPGIIKKIRSRGIPSDIYYFLKSHTLWLVYTASLFSYSLYAN